MAPKNSAKKQNNDEERESGFKTQWGEDTAKRASKTFSKAISKTKQELIDVQKTASSVLDGTLKTLNSYTDAQGRINDGVREHVEEIEKQVDTLKQYKRQIESYGSSLESMGDGLTNISEDMLKVLETTISRADKLTREYSKTNEAIFANSQDIMKRVQSGLKKNLSVSQGLWEGYSKAHLNSTKKHYLDSLEEEQRSMSDRLSWLEDYREKHFHRMTEADKAFFDKEYEEYKRRAEELEDLVKVAGADISNSVSESVKSIISNVRDIAIVSAARDALGSDIDDFIDNKLQMLPRTGANFDFKQFRGYVNSSTLNNPALSRNEYSEVYSDIVKGYRIQKQDELEYFGEDMANMFKAYGVGSDAYQRLVWADKNSGMQNQSFHIISNISAALEDNENLYVDATRLLSSIDEHIDSMAYVQYEDTGKFTKMYKSLATIEAVSESSAVKGTENFMNAMKEMVAVGGNQYDLMDNEAAKMMIQFTSLNSFKDISDAIANEEIDKYILEFQDKIKNSSDAQLYGLVKSGVTPWNTVSEAKGFAYDDIAGYLENAKNSVEEGATTEENLLANKASEATTMLSKLFNEFKVGVSPITDALGTLNIKMINLAAIATVASGITDVMGSVGSIATKLKGSKFADALMSSRVGKGFGTFYSSTANSISSGIGTVVESLGGIGATLGTLAVAFASFASIMAVTKGHKKQWENPAKVVGQDTENINRVLDSNAEKIKEENPGTPDFWAKTKAKWNYWWGKDTGDEVLEDLKTTKAEHEADAFLSNYYTLPIEEWDPNYSYADARMAEILHPFKLSGGLHAEQPLMKDGIISDSNNPAVVSDGVKISLDSRNRGYLQEKYNAAHGIESGTEEGYAKGLSNVPNDGFAYLHEGEAVLTKEQAINARADGGIPSLGSNLYDIKLNDNVEEGFTDVLMILRSMRGILENFFGMEEEQYVVDKREKKRQSLIKELFGGGSSGYSTGRGSFSLSNLFDKGYSSGGISIPGVPSKSTGNGGTPKSTGTKYHEFSPNNDGTVVYSDTKATPTQNLGTRYHPFSPNNTGETGLVAQSLASSGLSSDSSLDAWRDKDLKDWDRTISADRLNDWIDAVAPADSPFHGKGDMFLRLGFETGYDPVYIVSHAALESAWGMSDMAKGANNYFGYGAYDANPKNGYNYGGDTMELGMLDILNRISNGYYDKRGLTTLRSMRWNGFHQYATAGHWDSSIADIMRSSAAYAQGTPWLPEDQVAVVHQGEMIVPADNNPFNVSSTSVSNIDNSDVVEIVRWMANLLSTKFDTVIGSMVRNTRRAQVTNNSDMSYVYSR